MPTRFIVLFRDLAFLDLDDVGYNSVGRSDDTVRIRG